MQHHIYSKFDGQTLIIFKDSILKINNGHKKGKDLTYYILAYKAITNIPKNIRFTSFTLAS